MSLIYISVTGALEQIPSPLKSGVPLEEIVENTCHAMNTFTDTTWASGDYQMMRAAEKIAAAVALGATYQTCKAMERLLQEASDLVTLLKLAPSWRDR